MAYLRSFVLRDSSGKTFTPLPAAGMRYARVSIPREGGTRSHRTVHSLVYNTFVGAVPTGHSIDHLNRSALDNRLANLRVKSFRGKPSCSRQCMIVRCCSWLPADLCALRPIPEPGQIRWFAPNLARKVTDGSSTWKRFPGPMAASKQLRAVHKNKRKPCPTMDQLFRGSRVKTNGKHHYVHRLVAQAFLGAPKSQSLTVDHLDRVGTFSSKTVSCHRRCRRDVI